MKYNKSFIAAVYAMSHVGDEAAAEAVFNKLFGVGVSTAAEPAPYSYYVRCALNDIVRDCTGGNRTDVAKQVAETNREHGYGGSISWIKAYRERTSSGLLEAKRLSDYVRDNRDMF